MKLINQCIQGDASCFISYNHTDSCTSNPVILNYCRWLILCSVPSFCDSLPKHDVTAIFGRQFLKEVFPLVKNSLVNRFMTEQERINPGRREVISKLLPGLFHLFISNRCIVFTLFFFIRLLEAIESAVHSPNSPIWDPNFKPPISAAKLPHNVAQPSAQNAQLPVGAQTNRPSTSAVAHITSTQTALKQEPMEIEMAGDAGSNLSIEHPSAFTPHSQIKLETEGDVGPGTATISDPNDIPLELYNEICNDIDAFKSNGGGDV